MNENNVFPNFNGRKVEFTIRIGLIDYFGALSLMFFGWYVFEYGG